jgi:hypothetical protein
MEYMLMLVRVDEEWEALSEPEQDYAAIGRWFGQLAQSGVLRDGRELRPARTATTVHWERGQPVITDGPYIEAKESIGGYGIIRVDDLDAAIEIARSWPAQSHKVEIRPVVAHE